MTEVIKIYGGPGAGKTTRLLQIIMQELDNGVAPDRIMFTTHTNAGVNEGVRRALKAGKGEFKRNDLIYFATIHALCNRFASSGRKLVPMQFATEFKDAMLADGLTLGELATAKAAYAYAKSIERPLTEDEIMWKFGISTQAYDKYVGEMVSFTEQTNSVFRENLVSDADPKTLPIDVAIIDEAQDVTPDQWRVLEVFTRSCKRLYVAGDVNQAIFKWAGADARLFLNMPSHKEETLPITYRCTEQVWRLVTRIHTYYPETDRSPIPTECANKQQGFVRVLGVAELDVEFSKFLAKLCLSGASVFLLATTTKRLEQYRNFCSDSGIPFRDLRNPRNGDNLRFDIQAILNVAVKHIGDYVSGGKLQDGNESMRERRKRADELLKDVTFTNEREWLQICVDKIWELIQQSTQGLGSWRTKRRKATYAMSVALRAGDSPVRANVTISTVHRVKGAEADYVVYDMGEHTEVKSKHCDALTQLQHLFVACSRAKLGVTLFNTSTVRAEDGGVLLRDLVPAQEYHDEFSGEVDPPAYTENELWVYNEIMNKIADTWFAGSEYENDNSTVD